MKAKEVNLEYLSSALADTSRCLVFEVPILRLAGDNYLVMATERNQGSSMELCATLPELDFFKLVTLSRKYSLKNQKDKSEQEEK